MIRHIRKILTIALIAGCSSILSGQILYVAVYDNFTFTKYIYKVNLSDCSSCPITPGSTNIGGAGSMILQDGTTLNFGGNAKLRRLEPPPSVTVIWEDLSASPPFWRDGAIAPNGTVYLAGDGLATFDPGTNTVTFIGNWPPGIDFVSNMFYINGVLYIIGRDANTGDEVILEVNTSDPSQSTIVTSLPFSTLGAIGGNYNGSAGFFYSSSGGNQSDILFYDTQTNTSTFVCDLPNNLIVLSITETPPGVNEFPCLGSCVTDAGELNSATPNEVCEDETFTFNPAVQTNLEPDDLLQYIFFTNPNDTLGSILVIGNDPSFTFDPATMQTGVTYYVAAIAGNNNNGNVSLTDPCLDISNALEIIWLPLPTVTFTAGATDLCANNCYDITVTFTGTPPFQLSGEVTSGGNVIETFSNTFTGNTGVVEICLPAGTPPGPVSIEATALSDDNCSCN